ncbi:MAG TPA: RHS repeat-associated core domain-containing protein [Candidatus Angelobacter sp.]|nr:RHS repeat-associated core domain-containing protein [Candidatus Angelobacter sp.]
MKLGRSLSVLAALIGIIVFTTLAAMAQTQLNLLNGLPPQGSYDGSSADTVNLMNGNLVLHIPLPINYPQRGKLGIQYYLVVNAKTWHADPAVPGLGNQNQWLPSSACSTTPPTTAGPCGLGPLFVSTASFAMTRSYQKVFTEGQGTDYAVGDPDNLISWDGSTHGGGMFANDTSGYQILAAGANCSGVGCTLPYSGTIIDRNGTQYIGSWLHDATACSTESTGIPGSMTTTTTCSEHFAVDSVMDANGNVLNAPLGIPDIAAPHTNAPTIATHLASGSETAGCLTSFGTPWVGYLNYPAPNGQTSQIKLCFATYPQLATSFSPAGIHQFQDSYSGRPFPGNYRQPVYLSNVILPDNTQWSINYDSYGEITSVAAPTGAGIQYSWAEATFPSSSSTDITTVSRAVASRTLTDVNGHSFTWNYHWSPPASDGTLTHTVTDPVGNDTVHVFSPVELNPVVYHYNYKETRTTTYQGSGNVRTLLRQVDTTWAIHADGGLGVPTDQKTTLAPAGKVSLVHSDYDPGPGSGSPILGLVTAQKHYDWGQGSPGPLLREVDTTYQWQVNNNYLAANLIDLPASVITKDGSGCRMAETDYTYDETGYLTTYTGTLPTNSHLAAPNPVRGNPTSVTQQQFAGNACPTTAQPGITSHTNWYDTGEPYKQVDPLGYTTTHSYDPAYNGALPTQTCNALNQCVSATYDINTGLLTSFTNANATQQASGVTAGDSAHTITYSYDSTKRLLSAISPADSSGTQPQVSFNYPNATTIEALKKITASLTDDAITNFDGVGRISQAQHITPTGTATVKTTFDGLGHPMTVTNPFYTTSDITYGVTQSQYDALGRVTQTTKQDGSIATVSYTDNCTISTDEAGSQRKSCTDGLGRLIEVDEQNPGAAATNAVGTITISGSEQTANSQPAAAGHGSVTISGSEQSSTIDTCQDFGGSCPRTIWDIGSVSIIVNGHADTYNYSRSSTAASVASGLGSAINGDSASPVTASVSGSVVNLIAKTTGSATNYSLSSSTSEGDPSDFGSGSFFGATSGATLTGGQNASSTPDTGTVRATVNGTQYSVSYGPGDTASSIAGRLAAAISTGSYASASASGGTISLISKTAGGAGNYSLAASSTWNTGQFTNPSFTASTSGGSLAGGFDARVLGNNPYITLYFYDALGNLLCVEQHGAVSGTGCSASPSGDAASPWRVRRFTYDSLSHLLTASNPETGVISYFYDNNGNLLQKVMPTPNQTGTAQHTISFCYDQLNRVTGKAYSWQNCQGTQLPSGTAAVSYTYDSGTNGIGHLTSLTDQAGSGIYHYDVLDRLSSETRVIAGVSKNLSYTYNLDGSLKSITYPSGATVTYTPDSAGRVLSAVDIGNSINYVTGATYGAGGALTGFISGNSSSFAGITSSFSFNNRQQPVNMSAASPSATLFSLNYDFHNGSGNNGNVWGITNNKDTTRNQTFTYDPLNRLTSAQNAGTNCTQNTLNGKTKFWGNSYSYDAWGNLLTKTPTKCSAENITLTASASNQLQGYSYDAAGNMTHDLSTGSNYTFDQENRITGAAGYTYTYDADGDRVEKSNGTTSTLYWYMTPGIVAESDLSGNLQSEYVFFDGERVARKDLPSGNVAYYFSDNLKTASVIADAAGNIKSESDYYPWGGELQFANSDSNHYKFTGKERDSETGLDYFGARYYGNSLGRFITPDWAAKATAVPYADFADPQSLNLYTYVRNIPTTRLDADGHDIFTDVITYIAIHLGNVGTTEGNVRSQYNNKVAETKANQGGKITSAQRDAIKQEVRQGSTSTGRALAEAHDAETAAAKGAKAAAGTLEESAGRTNAGFNVAGKVGEVAGPALTGVAIGIAAYNVANAPEGQKQQTAASEGGGLLSAIGGGELGAEAGAALGGPWGAVGGGAIGAIGGGIFGKAAIDKLNSSPPMKPGEYNEIACAKAGMCGQK